MVTTYIYRLKRVYPNNMSRLQELYEAEQALLNQEIQEEDWDDDPYIPITPILYNEPRSLFDQAFDALRQPTSYPADTRRYFMENKYPTEAEQSRYYNMWQPDSVDATKWKKGEGTPYLAPSKFTGYDFLEGSYRGKTQLLPIKEKSALQRRKVFSNLHLMRHSALKDLTMRTARGFEDEVDINKRWLLKDYYNDYHHINAFDYYPQFFCDWRNSHKDKLVYMKMRALLSAIEEPDQHPKMRLKRCLKRLREDYNDDKPSGSRGYQINEGTLESKTYIEGMPGTSSRYVYEDSHNIRSNAKWHDLYSASNSVFSMDQNVQNAGTNTPRWNEVTLDNGHFVESRPRGQKRELNFFGITDGMEGVELVHSEMKNSHKGMETSNSGTSFPMTLPPENDWESAFGVVQRPTGRPFGLSTATNEDYSKSKTANFWKEVTHFLSAGLLESGEGSGQLSAAPDTESFEDAPSVITITDVSTTPGNAEVKWTYSNLLRRPRVIDTVTWSTALGSGAELYRRSVEQLIKQHPLYDQTFGMFTYFRFNSLNVRIMMQTNQFYQGVGTATWIPGLFTTAGTPTAVLNEILHTGKGTQFFMGQSEQLVCSIPWTYPRTWCQAAVFTSATNWRFYQSLGEFVAQVLMPLAAPTGLPNNIPLQILIDFEDIEFAVPLKPGAAEVPPPTLSEAELEGSKTEEFYYYPTTGRYNDSFAGASLTPTIQKNANCHRELKSRKEMTTSYLGSIWYLNEIVTTNNTDLPGHELFQGVIAMESLYPTDGIIELTHPVALLANNATFWAGSKCYKFIANKNAFQKMKVIFYYLPLYDPQPTTIHDMMYYPYAVWEIADSNIFELRVAEMRDRSLMTTSRAILGAFGPEHPSPIAVQGFAPGTLQMAVFSPLVSPTGSPSTVNIACYSSYYPGDVNGDHRLRLFGPVTGARWNRKLNQPTHETLEPELEAVMPQSFWANATRVVILGEDIQNSAQISTDAEEILDMSYFARRSQCTIYNKSTGETAPPPIAIEPGVLLNSGAFSSVYYMPDQHIHKYAQNFAYWGGGFQAMVLSNTDVVSVRQIPNPQVGYSEQIDLGTNPNFGSASGMQQMQGGSAVASVSLGMITQNDFFSIKNELTDDSFNRTGTSLVVESYDSVHQTYATRSVIYLSADSDFWLGGWRYLNVSGLQSVFDKEYAAAKFPITPTITELTEEEAMEHSLNEMTLEAGEYDSFQSACSSTTMRSTNPFSPRPIIEDTSDTTEEDDPDGGFLAETRRLPFRARQTIVQTGKTIAKTGKKAENTLDKITQKLDQFDSKIDSIFERANQSCDTAAAFMLNEKRRLDVTHNIIDNNITDLSTLIRNELSRVLGVIPSKADLTNLLLLLIDLCESFYFNTPTKWIAFAVKVAVTIGINFSIITKYVTFIGERLSPSNQSTEEGAQLEALSDIEPNKALIAGVSIVVMAMGLKATDADNFDSLKNKTTWEKLTTRARELHFGKMGFNTLKECYAGIHEMILGMMNEYVFSEPVEGASFQNERMKRELTELSTEFEILSKPENLQKLPLAGEIKNRFFKAYERFGSLRRDVISNPVERDLFTKYTVLSRLVERLETGSLDNFSSHEYRWDPLHICFVGGTSLGKSALMSHVADFLLDTQKESRESARIYPISPGMKHHDGYVGQRAMTIDDMDAIEEEEAIHEHMLRKSNNPLIMPMAHLLKKGMYFRSDLMISSSNVLIPLPKCMPFPEAYARRRDINIQVTMKPGATVKQYDFSHLEFSIVKKGPLKDPGLSDKFDIEALMGYLVPSYSLHLINQAKLARASNMRCEERPIIDYGLPELFKIREDIQTVWLRNSMRANDIHDGNIDVTSDLITKAPIVNKITLKARGKGQLPPAPQRRGKGFMFKPSKQAVVLKYNEGEHAGPCSFECPPLCGGDPYLVMDAGEEGEDEPLFPDHQGEEIVEDANEPTPIDLQLEEYSAQRHQERCDGVMGRITNDQVGAILAYATHWGIEREGDNFYFTLGTETHLERFSNEAVSLDILQILVNLMSHIDQRPMDSHLHNLLLNAMDVDPASYHKTAERIGNAVQQARARRFIGDMMAEGEDVKRRLEEGTFSVKDIFFDIGNFAMYFTFSDSVRRQFKELFDPSPRGTYIINYWGATVRKPRVWIESFLDEFVRELPFAQRVHFEMMRNVSAIVTLTSFLPFVLFNKVKHYTTVGILSLAKWSGMTPGSWSTRMLLASVNTMSYLISFAMCCGAAYLAFSGYNLIKDHFKKKTKEKAIVLEGGLPIQTHAHKDLPDDGKRYTHAHVCDDCSDVFCHNHAKHSEEVSKKFIHRCPKCKSKAKKNMESSMKGDAQYVPYYPDEEDFGLSDIKMPAGEEAYIEAVQDTEGNIRLEHRSYASDRGRREIRRKIRTESKDKPFVLLEVKEGKVVDVQAALKEPKALETFIEANETPDERRTRFNDWVRIAMVNIFHEKKSIVDAFRTKMQQQLFAMKNVLTQTEARQIVLQEWTTVINETTPQPPGIHNPNMLITNVSPDHEIVAAEMQGFSDPNVGDIAAKVYFNNGIIVYNNKFMTYMGLKEQKLLCNSHLVKDFTKSHYTFKVMRMGVWFEMTVPLRAIKVQECITSKLMPGVQFRPDYICIDFSTTPKMPAFSDMTSHFIRERDLDLVRGSDGRLLTRMGTKKIPGEPHTIHCANFQPIGGQLYKAGYFSAKAWNYKAPTEPGCCGSVLIVENPMIPNKLIGIHQANFGKGTNEATGMVITHEIIMDICGPQTYVNGPQLEDIINDAALETLDLMSVPKNAPTGRYMILGELKSNIGTTLKSDLRMTPLFDDPFVHTTEPAVLKATDPRNISGIHPLRNGLQKFDQETGNWNLSHRIKSRTHFLHQILKCDADYSGPTGFLTVYEAVNGIPGFVEPLNMRTSPGYPYVQQRPQGTIGKLACFKEIGESNTGQILYEPTLELKKEIDKLLTAALGQHRIVSNYFMDWPKDERRPLAKIEVAKTRLFNIHSVAWLIVTKMYAGSFTAAFMQARLRIGSALGINMHGPEVTKLVEHLLSVGNNMADGDVEKWDGGYDFETLFDMAWVVAMWYKKHNPNSDFWGTMTVLLGPTWRIHICGNVVYIVFIGLPSGWYLTAVFNTGGHRIRNYNVWQELTLMKWQEAMRGKEPELHEDVAALWKSLLNLNTLDEYVAQVMGGDDEVQSVAGELAELMNPSDIATVWKNHGIGYVPPQKIAGKTHATSWSTIEDVQFYKCHFKRNEEHQRFWHMAMDTEPCQELINWIRKGQPPIDALQANVRDYQHFSYAHGKEHFERVTTLVRNAAEEKGISLMYSTFEEFDELWKIEHELTMPTYL